MSRMNDLAIEVEDEGGAESYIKKASRTVKELKTDLREIQNHLEYLEGLHGPHGSNYDSQTEIDEAIEECEAYIRGLEKQVTELETKIDIVKETIK